MAQHRKPLPTDSSEWLAGYLDRKGIDVAKYPNELSTTQWGTLKAAYRQHTLQSKRINAVISILELKGLKQRVDDLDLENIELRDTAARFQAKIDSIRQENTTLVSTVKTLKKEVLNLKSRLN